MGVRRIFSQAPNLIQMTSMDLGQNGIRSSPKKTADSAKMWPFLGCWVHATRNQSVIKWPPTFGAKRSLWITWVICLISSPKIKRRKILLVPNTWNIEKKSCKNRDFDSTPCPPRKKLQTPNHTLCKRVMLPRKNHDELGEDVDGSNGDRINGLYPPWN